ncbi:DUF4810 domain-containing protein [Ferrimonas gelatinilytica]|uniref:DUF4810 domain-containing protein n=1 Tax=Ferrimonas gelatinilytica TaxID=1255257 RepID=A0ABP9SAG5_9GAMM
MHKHGKLALAAALLGALSGCASQSGLYHWGEYEDAVYEQQRAPEELEAYITQLTEVVNYQGKVIAPGLYAELGTAYLHAGKIEQAIFWYQKEQQQWPESQVLMEALISNLQRRLPTTQEVN